VGEAEEGEGLWSPLAAPLTRDGREPAKLDQRKRVFYRTGYARGWPRRRVTPGPSSVIGTAWLT
jgi:hypothetical protein